MMYQRRRAVQIVPFIAACTLLVPACSDSRTPTRWESWKTLRLEAEAGPLFSGAIEMRLEVTDGKKRFETESTARFLGAKIAQSKTITVIDAVTGRTELHEEISKRSIRRYRFGETGYSVEKLSPVEARPQAAEQWSVTASERFDYPRGGGGDPVRLYDAFGMLIGLRDLDLSAEGDEAVIHVATSHGPTALRVLVAETRAAKRTFTDRTDGLLKTLAFRELRLRIIPADPDEAPEGFLEMEGETELWVEAVSKTPVHLSGRVPRLSERVNLVLDEMG